MNEIQKYFQYRQSLIEQYAKGDLTKKEYLQRNYDEVMYGTIKPFRHVDTAEKGLFNYQYYNALAKRMKSASLSKKLEYDLKMEYLERSKKYYGKKDNATLKVLKILDFQGVEAYFIRVKSRMLKGRLIEILLEEPQMILHTTSETIRNCLQEEGVLIEGKRISLIDSYVNQLY